MFPIRTRNQTLLGKKPGGLIQYDKMWEDTRPFSNRKFIVPIHAKNHWAVVMVDVGGKSIIMYDSLADEDRSKSVISEIKAYVEEKLESVECNFDLDWSIDIEDMWLQCLLPMTKHFGKLEPSFF